jgi:malate/lactate dehydrogenase
MSASSGSIAIIGAGSVGAAIAYSLLLRQVVADIILVDINHEYCQAQVEDLSDATFLSVKEQQKMPGMQISSSFLLVPSKSRARRGLD